MTLAHLVMFKFFAGAGGAPPVVTPIGFCIVEQTVFRAGPVEQTVFRAGPVEQSTCG